MNKKDSKDHIRRAWELSEDPEKIRDYYRDWSRDYDRDVTGESYLGPRRMVELLDEHLRQNLSAGELRELKCLDAGCGTGLVGKELFAKGYRNLSGFDLSEEMVALAESKQCYKKLDSGVDLTLALETQINDRDFDVVICVGVLTLGHVPPSGAERMLEVIPPGGLLALNAREAYVKEQNFEQYCNQLVANRKVEIIHSEYSFLIEDAVCQYLLMRKI